MHPIASDSQAAVHRAALHHEAEAARWRRGLAPPSPPSGAAGLRPDTPAAARSGATARRGGAR